MAYQWVPIARGQPVHGGAVMTGRTSTDGDVYVGRNNEGEVGKLNLDNGRMYNIWCHHGGQTDQGMHLVMSNGAVQAWKPFDSGDPLPSGAVQGGSNRKDGTVYVGREKHGACGKITLNRDGTIKNLWVHGNLLPWHHGEVLVCAGGAPPVSVSIPIAQAVPVAQAIPIAPTVPVVMGGMAGMWNPNAMCDGSRAEERAIWLQQNQGMNFEAARQKVMSEFPQQFGGCGWNPNAMCDGSRAEDRAIWLRDNKGMNMDLARQQVMREFPGMFGGAGCGGYGKMYNPNALCDGIRAEERVLWLQQHERMSVDMARERVMREFPGSF